MRGQHLAIRVPHFQARVVQHGGTFLVLKLHALSIGADRWVQTAAHREREDEIRLMRLMRPLAHREPMLQTAPIVHEPLLHRRIPLISEPLPRRLHRRHAADCALLAGKAVALQLQPPRPPAALRLRHKTAPVELRHPLLPRIQRLPAVIGLLKRMTPRFVSLADARPVGLREPFRNLLGTEQWRDDGEQCGEKESRFHVSMERCTDSARRLQASGNFFVND